MTAILGLDVGERRIGVAISAGYLASPLTTVVRTSDRDAVAAIAQIATEQQVQTIVVGIPLGHEGEETEQVRRVQAFGRKLKTVPGVQVIFWDERLTTKTASAAMLASRPKKKGPPTPRQREEARRRLDAAAAAIILQDYLDAQENRLEPARHPGPPAESSER